MLLNAAKFPGYSFYHSWVIKGKPTGGGIKLPAVSTQIRVKGTITVVQAPAAAPNNDNLKVIFKICAPFTNYIRIHIEIMLMMLM